MKYKNLADLFQKRAEKYGRKVFVRYKTKPSGPFVEHTWDEVQIRVEDIAFGLKALGVKTGDNIGLLSNTCFDWMACDLGIMSLGACTVPIYPSSTTESVKYIVKHAHLEFVIVKDKIQLQKLRSIWAEIPFLRYAIVIQDRGDIPTDHPHILTIEDLVKIGDKERRSDPDAVKKISQEFQLDDIASIIYTSGTTGEPKGVVLTHRNFLVAALSFYQYVPLEEGCNMLSFLPLAHVFERVASELYGIDQGVVFTYCEYPEHLPQLLIESGCNVTLVVPRILEKIHEKIINQVNHSGLVKKELFYRALDVGLEYVKKKIDKEPISMSLAAKHKLAWSTVLSKVKEKISPTLKVFVVGGAPFSVDIAYFFMALGFQVVEGYGLTETTAPISVNPIWANRPGTVGIPFSHFDVKIAEDGEILCRGDAVFKGYYKNPEATREAIIDGWFHTGDLGEFDEKGYLKITGRKKDLIITAGGKNVAPQKVETELLKSKYISQVVILGDKERYLAALVVLNEDEIKKYCKERDIQMDKSFSKMEELRKLIEFEIQIHSGTLASYEQIKAFHILDEELTIDGGELTPTLKIKRNFVMQKYKNVIDPLFKKSVSGTF